VTAAAKADLVSQLRALIYPGFLAATPITWLSHYPRYLQGIQLRIDRAGRDGGDRDAQRHAQYHPYWAAYVKFANGRRPDELPPSVERLRWMIEEWRVSLFAQELGTAETVSDKRIQKQWEECQREIRRG
jgi:ATP-dependent helicase HrpA